MSLSEADRVEKLDIDGISTLPDSRRLYPQGALAAQVIGAVGAENEGLTGLEQSQDATLGGDNGEQEVVHDARGAPIRFDTIKQASVGDDLRLTIDAAIQDRAEEAIAEAGEHYSAAGASAVVMDPDTGDVLAMANWPGFDPTELDEASPEQLANRATGFTYEPGSTFKAFTVAAALEEGLVTPDTSFHLPSTIQVADREIEEAHARPPIDATVAEILAQSSNVGAVTIGLEVGRREVRRLDPPLRLRRADGRRLPGRGAGHRARPRRLLGLDHGQPADRAGPVGDADADGGRLLGDRQRRRPAHPPADRRRPAASAARPTPTGTRVISADTSAKVRTMLEGVLAAGGTASEVEVPGYELAGKTGTAEKAVDGGYSETDYVASFVGFAPAEDPELLVA